MARAECYLVGKPDLPETIARLRAYVDAGADRLYAPGLRTRDEIAAVVAAVAPKPVNLLIGWSSDLTVADVAALGVRRISVGGALARAAWGVFMRAARLIAEEGTQDCAVPSAKISTPSFGRSLATVASRVDVDSKAFWMGVLLGDRGPTAATLAARSCAICAEASAPSCAFAACR